MNRVIVKGRLTADPDMRYTSNGVEFCNITVAVDRYSKGEDKVTDFIPCRAWRQTAAFIHTYFPKGREILVEGSLNVEKYERDGEKRTYTYVTVDRAEFCGSKNSATSDTPIPNPKPDIDAFDDGPQAPPPAKNSGFENITGDDDLPF